MDTRAIKVGDKLTALFNQTLDVPSMRIMLWNAGDSIAVRGIVDHDWGREFILDPDSPYSDWENVPESTLPELFITQ